MTEETNTAAPATSMGRCCGRGKHFGHHGTCGGVYGMAFIGAVVYYLQHADTFWVGVLGVLKAIVWPAMVIYKLLEFLKM